MIRIKKTDDDTFQVTVSGETETTHTVTLTPAFHEKLTKGKISPEELVEKSFQFLLERESNTSILSRFDLTVIGHYFPEYEARMKAMLK